MRSILLALLTATTAQAEIPTPVSKNPNLQVQLFASEPEIVTPIGMAFDDKDRLLVIESHTHFPPKNYPGPKTDRIRLLEDTTGDGKADRVRTFFEGSIHTMSLARGKDGWIYVATRNEVFRIKDSTRDDKADKRESLVKLETKGKYPHNGLCGLCFDGVGRLYFGMGENLGVAYSLIGKDGKAIKGGGEGGNIFRCTAEGKSLIRVATGFWNPFGITIGPHGRIFTVDNDPDSSPPCRLIHVVPGGDYGYQFRYGRSGRHPLQAWNGELPGTLPMMAGTGEAPCEVRIVAGKLWSPSWGDNRIETYSLKARGASWGADRRTLVEGTLAFRPVGLLESKDGSLFVSDWADKSYPVHRKGRIWKLTWKKSPKQTRWPALTGPEKRANALRSRFETKALSDPDPFIRAAARWALINNQKTDRKLPTDSAALVETAKAIRWRFDMGKTGGITRDDWIRTFFEHKHPEVRFIGLKWIADAEAKSFRRAIEQSMQNASITPRLFLASLATLEWLDKRTTDRRNKPIRDRMLFEVLQSKKRSPKLRALAARLIDPNYKQLTPKLLGEFARGKHRDLRREAIRTLTLRTAGNVDSALLSITKDSSLSATAQADAVWGLGLRAKTNRNHLQQWAPREDDVGREARRALSGPQRTVKPENLPKPADLTAWKKLSAGKGNADRGWRLFFGAAKCAGCHSFGGRGRNIGPDLSTIGKRRSREKILQAILEPGRDVAPQYTPHILRLQDGRTKTGLPVYDGAPRDKERYVDVDGTLFDLKPAEITARRNATESIMPKGIEKLLSVQEIRDLLALLGATADPGR